ncbi:MAG: class I SAM-dependent methyltransferase [Acidobacteria bacterium]|nr:class I SAM-dependent methyltransferase [Acidobacteriota bacterium]
MRDFDSVQRVDLIRQMCTGKRVLHLGCTNYPYTEDAIREGMLLHFDLEKIASHIDGIDADREGIEILEKHGSQNLHLGNLESLEECSLNGTYDVIVAGEVIEHVNNPGLFLTGIRRFMNADTQLIVTTVNAYCGMRFFYYGARGRRGEAEPVHPDHVAYYSYSTLKLLLERHQFEIQNFYFYDVGHEHSKFVRWFLKLTNRICVMFAPQWSDGVIAVCKLRPE